MQYSDSQWAYVKSWIVTNWIKFSVSSSNYTTALGIRQEVEQIRANFFYSTFLNVFLLCPLFYVFNVFYYFWNVFYTYAFAYYIIQHLMSMVL